MVTIIPKNPLETYTKLIISGLVVVLYAFIDWVSSIFSEIKTIICRLVCQCK